MFSIREDKDGKEQRFFCHGICWIHARRNFCELINYDTHKDGTSVADMVKNNCSRILKTAKNGVKLLPAVLMFITSRLESASAIPN